MATTLTPKPYSLWRTSRRSPRLPSLKLNSLGKLTASIAHEIRNPLTAISHASQLMDEGEEDPGANAARHHSPTPNGSTRLLKTFCSYRDGSRPNKSRWTLAWMRLFVPNNRANNADCVDLQASEFVGTGLDPGNLRRCHQLLDNGSGAGEHTGQFTVTLAPSKDDQAQRAHMDVIDAGTGYQTPCRAVSLNLLHDFCRRQRTGPISVPGALRK